MSQKATVTYKVYASQVLAAAFDLDYQIPTPSGLQEMLQAKKVLAMPVDCVRGGDFVTADIAAFLNYVRLNNIKTVMYSFRFYTAEDIEEFYRLSPADKAFFQRKTPGSYVPDAAESVQDGFEQYQLYCRYIEAAIDLEYPKEVWLYALHNGKTVTCTVEDAWLERLPLPNAQSIRDVCLKSVSYSGEIEGMLAFSFVYDTAAPEECEFSEERDGDVLVLEIPPEPEEMREAAEAPRDEIPDTVTDLLEEQSAEEEPAALTETAPDTGAEKAARACEEAAAEESNVPLLGDADRMPESAADNAAEQTLQLPEEHSKTEQAGTAETETEGTPETAALAGSVPESPAPSAGKPVRSGAAQKPKPKSKKKKKGFSKK